MEVEVIKKKEGKIDRHTGKVISENLKVAAYARVSTDHEDQKTSFASQQKYYLEKIYSNPKWAFVDIYADEGISGTQVLKRDNFMRMIKDCEDGKIDLTLTKSISRFARNTLETLKYVRSVILPEPAYADATITEPTGNLKNIIIVTAGIVGLVVLGVAAITIIKKKKTI